MLKMSYGVHPLFFLFGIYYAFTGRVFVFITYTLVAVVHEIGHAMVASSLGYRLNKITLMPYGAVVSGDITGLRFSDEVKVALAGPLINLFTSVLFIALWWVLPETYAYTDLAVSASLSVALVNLIPCAPLDGGRILKAMLSGFLPRKTVSTVMTVSGIAFSCVLGGLFVFTCFHKVNISLLFFALFALFGTVGVSREAKYVRLFDGSFSKVLKRGGTVRRIAVAETVTVKRLMILLDCKALNEVCVYDREGHLTDTVSEKELLTILSGENLYKTVGEALREENKTI